MQDLHLTFNKSTNQGFEAADFRPLDAIDPVPGQATRRTLSTRCDMAAFDLGGLGGMTYSQLLPAKQVRRRGEARVSDVCLAVQFPCWAGPPGPQLARRLSCRCDCIINSGNRPCFLLTVPRPPPPPAQVYAAQNAGDAASLQATYLPQRTHLQQAVLPNGQQVWVSASTPLSAPQMVQQAPMQLPPMQFAVAQPRAPSPVYAHAQPQLVNANMVPNVANMRLAAANGGGYVLPGGAGAGGVNASLLNMNNMALAQAQLQQQQQRQNAMLVAQHQQQQQALAAQQQLARQQQQLVAAANAMQARKQMVMQPQPQRVVYAAPPAGMHVQMPPRPGMHVQMSPRPGMPSVAAQQLTGAQLQHQAALNAAAAARAQQAAAITPMTAEHQQQLMQLRTPAVAAPAPAAAVAHAPFNPAPGRSVGVIGDARKPSHDGAMCISKPASPRCTPSPCGSPSSAKSCSTMASSGNGAPSEAADGDKQALLLACLGARFAEMGITVEQALASGFLGSLNSEQLSVLSEAHAGEATRITTGGLASEGGASGGSSLAGASSADSADLKALLDEPLAAVQAAAQPGSAPAGEVAGFNAFNAFSFNTLLGA